MLFPLVLLATSVDVAAQQPSISVHDVVVSEGNSGTTQATFVVELSAPAPASPAVSFSYATSSTPDGTATAGTDYVAASGGPITFAAGQTQKQVVVDVKGDTVDEQQEFFYLDILNVQNATVSSSRGKGFIVDDDGPTISINDVSITEGNSGTKNATFTLTLSGPSVEAIAVRVETAGGTATASSDYNSINVVVLFQPTEVTHTVDVQIIGDTNLESNETFFVNITEAFATTIADGQGIGTILDDDTPDVTVAVSPSSVAEDGATNLIYTFTRTGVTAGALTVNFSVGGTAAFGTDYTQTGAATFGASSGTVTIGAGNSSATVTIDPTADATFEPDETIILTVTSGTGYNIANPSLATGTITNDDVAPPSGSLQFSSGTYSQGESSGTLTITVTRTGGSAGAASVQFSNPAGGTATGGTSCTAGVDYITPSGTLNWGDGVTTSQTFNITICSDNVFEGNETVSLQLTNATGASLGNPNTATFTITDDETLQLVLEQSGPAPQQAAAVESLLFTRDAFKVESIALWFNLPPSQNTFVMIFAQNLTLNPGETAASVVVHLDDGQHPPFDLAATDVRAVPNADLTQVLFQLPDTLAPGTCNVTINAHGQTSNTGTIRITP